MLHEIKVHRLAGAHNKRRSSLRGANELFGAVVAPPSYNLVNASDSHVEGIVPADQSLSEHGHAVRHTVEEIALHILQRAEFLALHQRLHVGITQPCLAAVTDFVSAQMQVLAGEERGHLSQYRRQISVCTLLARIEGEIGLGRAAAAVEFRVRTVGSGCVAGHVDFRHDCDVPLGRIGNNLAYVVLGVEGRGG